LRKTCSNKHSPPTMRIITYSDLHLEFGSGWMLPPAVNGDVMILAGDIVTLSDYEPLDQILRKWKKPVLYVTGNHEYYTRRPMNEEECRFKAWLEDRHQHVKLLLDEEVSIGGVNFFGGTMWTDFNGGDLRVMETARSQMNDYRLIYNPDETPFTPAGSIALHKNFASKLLNWFGKNLSGPRVVISHNAPVINPNSKYEGGPLTPAFNSLNMVEIIETHQPALAEYGLRGQRSPGPKEELHRCLERCAAVYTSKPACEAEFVHDSPAWPPVVSAVKTPRVSAKDVG
jgi:hypothetical protein